MDISNNNLLLCESVDSRVEADVLIVVCDCVLVRACPCACVRGRRTYVRV